MSLAATMPDRRRTDRRRAALPPIVAELSAALEGGEIEVLFQPLFAAADDRLIGAEALCHWKHPRQGQIAGDRLFAIAGQGSFAEKLSKHVTGSALRSAGTWPADLRLAINVTAADVLSTDFAGSIASAAAYAGVAPERLTIEITEQMLLADLDLTARNLRELADQGVRLALDDFGAGFCNFDYLKRLPLHYLKLDRAMVEGIDTSPRDLVVLRGIVTMARALGLEVIAEGVERESQRDTIARVGCTGWQGFLGACPMPSADLASLLTRSSLAR